MVGLVTFTSNDNGGLDRLSTQRFLRAVQSAQPGTRVVELGSEAQVLASVNGRAFDVPTLRAIRETHGVDVLVMGRVDVEKTKPNVNVSTFMKSLSVSQDVDVTLGAKLVETASGATMWSNGAEAKTNLAHASVSGRGGGRGHFGASDPEAVYGEMIDGMVYQMTDDFRVHYVTRRVVVEETAVASTHE
jgi:hypothetical protein